MSVNSKKYLKILDNENAKNVVPYLGDVNAEINGTAYVGWQAWGEFLK